MSLLFRNTEFVNCMTICFYGCFNFDWDSRALSAGKLSYKTTLSWWIFALAGVLALGIALLTVSWQSWRAATRNPVEALQYK